MRRLKTEEAAQEHHLYATVVVRFWIRFTHLALLVKHPEIVLMCT